MPNKSSVDVRAHLNHADGTEITHCEQSQEASFALDSWNACSLKPSSREDPRKTEALIKAAGSGDVNGVRELLHSGAQVWHLDANGGTSLHFAAYCGRVGVARLLLHHRADPNAPEQNNTRATAMHAAAMHGHLALVELLLWAGGRPSATDGSGRTPADLAHLRGHSEVVQLLSSSVPRDNIDFAFAAPIAQEEVALECNSLAAKLKAQEARKAFFETSENATLLEAAGLGKMADPSLLVVLMGTLSTAVLDAHSLAEPFEFGTWSHEGTRVLTCEIARLESVVASSRSTYTRVLLIVPLGHERWQHDAWTKSLWGLANTEPEGSPLRALHTVLHSVVPRAELLVYNSSVEVVTGQPRFPQLQRSIAKLHAQESQETFFNHAANTAIFEMSGLGQIHDPKLLVIFMGALSTEILDVRGLAEPFEFGARSPDQFHGLTAELTRLGSVISSRNSNYVRVLLILPSWNETLPLDAWTRSLKSFANGEPEGSPVRMLRITLKGALPRAKLLVYNSAINPATGQPWGPQLELSLP